MEYRWIITFGGHRKECREKSTKRLLGAIALADTGQWLAMRPGKVGRVNLGGYPTAKEAAAAVEREVLVNDERDPETQQNSRPRRRTVDV